MSQEPVQRTTGFILSWAPPGGYSGTVPASRLSHGGTATRGDIDDNGAVDSVDIALFPSAWGTADIWADLDRSGQVGSTDITILPANWTG